MKFAMKVEKKLLSSLLILHNVTTVGTMTFDYCTALINVTILASVISSEKSVFSLVSVNFENTSGWYLTTTSTATNGADLSVADLKNTFASATYLKLTCVRYYCYCSE